MGLQVAAMSHQLEIASLGRPFQLGSLYDRITDSLVAGVTLWNTATLNKCRQVSETESCETEIIVEDTFQKMTSAFKVDGNLKLSFLLGLVEVSGSGNYLRDRKLSSHEARVDFHFKSTSKFEALSMEHLSCKKVQFPDVLQKGIATHVVAGIQYGADAFFVFRHDVSSSEGKRNSEVELKLKISEIFRPILSKFVAIEPHLGKMNKTQAEGGRTRMTCTYHGDIGLAKTPTTVEEAIETYKILPELARQKCVPKTIYLLPLHTLFDRSMRMVREIGGGITNDVETLLEGLHELNVRANDLAASPLCDKFPGMRTQLKKFNFLLDLFRRNFQESLLPLVKTVRASDDDEDILSNFLKEQASSPFQYKKLSNWLHVKEAEVRVIEKYMERLQGVRMAFSPPEFESVIHDLTFRFVVCFKFKCIPDKDSYLHEMSRYLRPKEKVRSPPGAFPKKWYKNEEAVKGLREATKYFFGLFKACRQSNDIQFVVTQKIPAAWSSSLCKIVCYMDGILETFLPPGRPGIPRALKKMGDYIKLTWDPPVRGAESIQGYLVSYKADGSEEWDTCKVQTNSSKTTVGGLRSNTKYVFKKIERCLNIQDA
ncbi:unnamed protein product [Darwinula stevensoni]|uniref:Fibronectin type-III domain-containing protein n=1 Tax=Darwinula stevensoni TaxID=69355 RepID=A0A7R9AB05_9CRUS|nr:unnamed protein product [Darwinula stevensoni]CAG0898896.1 unnamed protein product [Darwinula stevensoni]